MTSLRARLCAVLAITLLVLPLAPSGGGAPGGSAPAAAGGARPGGPRAPRRGALAQYGPRCPAGPARRR